ncbi:nucleotidyltransferase domain-containing protein [Fibrella arboris]|uniref:nucleotidyltransferase domain-containing protein n=1 Tax=Fibrella arboris TaxID=3242486 RepID=UPI00351FD0F6
MMLSKLTEMLRQFFTGQPVRRAYVFGSVARGEATELSDVDVLIELDHDASYNSRAS